MINATWPYPNKTRIKSTHQLQECSLCHTTRPYPNKTRIKTKKMPYEVNEFELQDHIPTKQGLRHDFVSTFHNNFVTTRPYPNKTRIKTALRIGVWCSAPTLQDHIPTKQGLRRIKFENFFLVFIPTRPYPNKTRIKTFAFYLLKVANFNNYKTISQQNKD